LSRTGEVVIITHENQLHVQRELTGNYGHIKSLTVVNDSNEGYLESKLPQKMLSMKKLLEL